MLTAARPIFVIGVQKSGTSLLMRLLESTGVAANPFRGEGDAFWGNQPPFSPTGHPAGRLYQLRGGEAGHRLTPADATPEVRAVLHERLEALGGAGRPILNKSPYNTVRIAWLRAIFPDALIVAVVRSAVPNVYSLAKKHVPHEGDGRPPEEGWWGVKPVGWRSLIGPDKLLQSARQWAAVNALLLEERDDVDLVVPYALLCGDPGRVLHAIRELAGGGAPGTPLEVPELRCHDEEYRTGSRLRSKNRYWRERGSLETPAREPAEFPPLRQAQVEAVRALTSDVEREIDRLAQSRAGAFGSR